MSLFWAKERSSRHGQPVDTATGNGRKTRVTLVHILLPICVGAFVLQYLVTLVAFEAQQHSESRLSPALKWHRSSNNNNIDNDNRHSRRLRVIMGILSADYPNDETYRRRHRQLFDLWDDPRVCSLPDFKAKRFRDRYQCELIYVFVLGGNPEASTELVDDSRPYEVPKQQQEQQPKVGSDLNNPDTIFLNIKENMNEGKSQTWMYYGSKLAETYDLDYVAKCDSDSLLHLHEFFQFAYKQLPPSPYNTNVMVGALRDKAGWPQTHNESELVQYESFFGNTYEGVHLYVAGQLYMLSKDLADFVGREARESHCPYCEGHEDHDVSAMAFHSPEPVKLIVIGRPHRFWEHPVKGEPRWRRILARETARVKGRLFEGKRFMKNSTFDALYPNL